MAYEVVMPYHLHMPSYFLETFTEYPYNSSIRCGSVSEPKSNCCIVIVGRQNQNNLLFCHPKRSEGSIGILQILRKARNDR